MTDDQSPDELLDEVVTRIRETRVPDCPPLTLPVRPAVPQLAPVRRNPLTACAAVAGSLVMLLVLLAGLAIRHHHPSTGPDRVTRNAMSTDSGMASVNIRVVDASAELDRMTNELDRISARLDRLEQDVALQEVRSDAAALFAEFTPRQDQNR